MTASHKLGEFTGTGLGAVYSTERYLDGATVVRSGGGGGSVTIEVALLPGEWVEAIDHTGNPMVLGSDGMALLPGQVSEVRANCTAHTGGTITVAIKPRVG